MAIFVPERLAATCSRSPERTAAESRDAWDEHSLALARKRWLLKAQY